MVNAAHRSTRITVKHVAPVTQRKQVPLRTWYDASAYVTRPRPTFDVATSGKVDTRPLTYTSPPNAPAVVRTFDYAAYLGRQDNRVRE